eukprot:2917228-Amphidinium_carterae.1
MDSRESAAREEHLNLVKFSGVFGRSSLLTLPECYRADREIVLAAVQRSGYALQYAAEECKADHDIVLAAMQKDGSALQYAAEECKRDHEI